MYKRSASLLAHVILVSSGTNVLKHTIVLSPIRVDPGKLALALTIPMATTAVLLLTNKHVASLWAGFLCTATNVMPTDPDTWLQHQDLHDKRNAAVSEN
jgi:hypothetical protein